MAVAFDAVGPSATGTISQGAPPATLTWSHTCSGSDRLLIVTASYATGGAYGGSDAGAALSATYNGVSMTSVGVRHSNDSDAGFGQMFYLVNPPTGSNTVAVSVSGWLANNADIIAGSVSFTGVDQSTPVQNYTNNAGDGSSASLSVSTAATNLALALVVCGSSINSDSQTTRWSLNANTSTAAGNVRTSTGNSTSTASFTYSVSSDWWTTLGVDIVAVSNTLTPLPWVL